MKGWKRLRLLLVLGALLVSAVASAKDVAEDRGLTHSFGVPEAHAGMMVTPSVKLVRPLGEGGMGAVWVADHLALRTQVVVKFIAKGLKDSKEATERFSREAAAAAQVKSPHVVQTFDHGFTNDGIPYIVMELLEGRDLGEFLEGQFDFEYVPAGGIARAAFAVALRRAERRAGIAVAGSDAASALFAELELWDGDLRQRNRNEIAALLPDHLAAADVLRQVRLHLAAHELMEALRIAIDFLAHGRRPSDSTAAR